MIWGLRFYLFVHIMFVLTIDSSVSSGLIMITFKKSPPLPFFRTCQSLVGSDRRLSLQKLRTVGVRQLCQRGRPSGGRVWLPHQDGRGDSAEGKVDFR